MSTANFNVWQPQGNVVANPGGSKIGNPSIIPGLTGIVLGGTVFGMWAGLDSTGKIYYFESVDGLTGWTAYSGNPISPASGNAFHPTVYKDGSTFYLFGSTTLGVGISVFTSSDGVNWTSHGSQIAVGGVGTWDQSGVFQLNLLTKQAGTWYAYYSGFDGAQYGQGLVTSPDLITWTKSVSNPIFPAPIGNMCFLTVDGTYYAYANFPSPNTALMTTQNNPIGRWSATNPAGPWTQLKYNSVKVPVYYVSTSAELNTGGGLPGANANDQRIVSANGNMYLYYTNTRTGGIEQGVNAALASGYTPAQLVNTYEGVRNVPFTGLTALNLKTLANDTFVRANANPIGGNWAPRVSGNTAQILSNVVRSSATATPGDSYWSAIAWDADQWSQITINNETTGSFVGSAARISTSGAATAYRLILQTGTGAGAQLVTQSQVASVATTIENQALIIAANDTLMLVVIGSNVYTYWNDYLIAANPSATIASGAAGFEVQGTTLVTNSGLSGWSGGSFQDSPLIVPPGTLARVFGIYS